jgi:hypothetical protein
MHRIPPRIIRENYHFMPVKLYAYLPFLVSWGVVRHDITSDVGTETTETTRRNDVFKSPLHGNFTLKAYEIQRTQCYYYVDTVATTYHYRMYVRPVQIADDGTITDLDVESVILALDRGAAASAGWVYDSWAGGVQRLNLNIPIKGYLGFRLRTTSWADAPANSGHGYTLGDPLNWWIAVEIEREIE